jgi:hypothetical protein
MSDEGELNDDELEEVTSSEDDGEGFVEGEDDEEN